MDVCLPSCFGRCLHSKLKSSSSLAACVTAVSKQRCYLVGLLQSMVRHHLVAVVGACHSLLCYMTLEVGLCVQAVNMAFPLEDSLDSSFFGSSAARQMLKPSGAAPHPGLSANKALVLQHTGLCWTTKLLLFSHLSARRQCLWKITCMMCDKSVTSLRPSGSWGEGSGSLSVREQLGLSQVVRERRKGRVRRLGELFERSMMTKSASAALQCVLPSLVACRQLLPLVVIWWSCCMKDCKAVQARATQHPA